MTMPPGQAAILAEMARQHADALATLETARPAAEAVAASLRRTGRLTLLGMGGSHWVNRTAATLYRALGVDVEAAVLSEVLLAPLSARPRTVLITSQSGRSGEVVLYLDGPARAEERFGLTMDAESPLGQAVPALVGVGGPEQAFAATRSLLVTLALHTAVLAALGVDSTDCTAALRHPAQVDAAVAVAALRSCSAFVLTGRGVLQGVAEAGALCIMELARCPALAMDGGQLRHGPMEMLSPSTGVVVLRGPGPAAGRDASLATACRDAGAPVVVLDASGSAPVEGVVTLAFPARDGMAAVFGLLPTLQAMLIAIAADRIPAVGTPVRSTKVTTTL
jgi:fructoselysine-6-P-deglycase FrlB-like protein